jgi:NADH-quinone oxidoreductase subunit F
MQKLETVDDFEALHGRLLVSRDADIPTIVIPAGTCGQASGANDLIRIAKRELLTKGLTEQIHLRITGCHGFCEMEPSVLIEPTRTFYPKVDIEKMVQIVSAVSRNRIVNDLLFVEKKTGKPIEKQDDIPFFKRQTRTLLARSEKVDPIRIYTYIETGGYATMTRIFKDGDPTRVVKEIKASGLRGRGGAGFPTGLKWEMLLNQPNGRGKIVVCNADEGDPGAYMDRSILEGNPHSIIEGMIIGAYATGAGEGVIYVRNEYPMAIKHLIIALRQSRELGLLGENILGSGFSFDIRLVKGAGAFVCGEETALIQSVEGKMGIPSQKPPFPIQKGIDGKPTAINNVETWANVPVIMGLGASEFKKIGVENNTGTKIFSLVGKVKNTGLVEVPMGTPIEEIITEIGGGAPVENMKIKAVQTGGPSGGCIPASLFDLPIDYDSLLKAGSMMGSGGMIVMDEHTCMVDVAKYFMNFLRDESCGKCLSCREGTQRMWEILDRITRGKGVPADIGLLEELAAATKDASMCGLGQTAANPVLSTLRYFRDEYEAHIKYKKCPAVVCKHIISSPCQHTCPIDTEAPQYIAYIAHGQFDKAYDIILKDNPLLNICARVCHHPCETKCRAGQGGKPISIRALKRAAIQYSQTRKRPARKHASSDIKVAVIGSGPSGLMAAHNLAHRGYAPTIFEALPVAGGMLAVGIPDYRLPKKALQEDINRIKNAGVEIQTGKKMGRDFSLEELSQQGYKAVYIAIGAHKSIKLGIPNEEISGVIPAMEFLTHVSLGKKVNIGARVGVIGGGNSAVDAARVANRLAQVKEVSIIYRRTRNEMPAYAEEIEAALEEGINIRFLTAPTEIIAEEGHVTGIKCTRMELGTVDASGRRRPVPIKGSDFVVELDTLISAISEQPDVSFLPQDHDFEVSGWNTFVVDNETLATNLPGIFAGGDAIRGPSSVIEAMADGKKAAEAIDQYLTNGEIKFTYKVTRPSIYVEPVKLTVKETLENTRQETKKLNLAKRKKNFDEVDLGLSRSAAIKEAKRCLRCDLEVKEADEKEQK